VCFSPIRLSCTFLTGGSARKLIGTLAMTYKELRDPRTGKLLARYNPKTGILEFKNRGLKCHFDLEKLREGDSRVRRDESKPARDGT
jgi:hypothetical protein